jgi:quercetin dioxygenase-like cupin family protein
VSSFKVNRLELPAGAEGPEHDHAADGEEEVYAVLEGGGTLRVDGEEVTLSPGVFVFCSPEARRQMVAGDSGLTWIGIGATK